MGIDSLTKQEQQYVFNLKKYKYVPIIFAVAFLFLSIFLYFFGFHGVRKLQFLIDNNAISHSSLLNIIRNFLIIIIAFSLCAIVVSVDYYQKIKKFIVLVEK